MRAILSKYLNFRPEDVAFKYGPSDKPYLADVGDLHFNFSHSDDLALIAIRRGELMGIDVERIDRPLRPPRDHGRPLFIGGSGGSQKR